MNEIRKFNIAEMVGRVAEEINVRTDTQGSMELEFKFRDGLKVVFGHESQCCESVYIESIIGTLCDLIDEPLLVAEEVFNSVHDNDDTEMTQQWTFYKFGTIRGGVTIRWIGESNGYYSTAVDITGITQ